MMLKLNKKFNNIKFYDKGSSSCNHRPNHDENLNTNPNLNLNPKIPIPNLMYQNIKRLVSYYIA